MAQFNFDATQHPQRSVGAVAKRGRAKGQARDPNTIPRPRTVSMDNNTAEVFIQFGGGGLSEGLRRAAALIQAQGQ